MIKLAVARMASHRTGQASTKFISRSTYYLKNTLLTHWTAHSSITEKRLPHDLEDILKRTLQGTLLMMTKIMVECLIEEGSTFHYVLKQPAFWKSSTSGRHGLVNLFVLIRWTSSSPGVMKVHEVEYLTMSMSCSQQSMRWNISVEIVWTRHIPARPLLRSRPRRGVDHSNIYSVHFRDSIIRSVKGNLLQEINKQLYSRGWKEI